MKHRHKLILDAGLVILLLLLMCYSFTGGLIHEILGIVILAGFIIHVILNRKYYGVMARALRNKKTPAKIRVEFAVNILLPAVSVVLLISSLAISNDLFPSVRDAFGSYGAWVMVHVISAVFLLVCVFVHVCLHAGMFRGLIRSAAKNPSVIKAWRAGSRVLAVVLAVLIIKAGIDSVADAASVVSNASSKNVLMVTITADSGEEGQAPPEIAALQDETKEQSVKEEPEPDEQDISLDDYLSAIKCTGCSKHCLLIAPQCNKGVKQASRAEEEYYEIYGE